ncbi:unnamed protein product [Blepharisma stoltei]|uniref:Uncharacterized protein n=1 Tax=Blepharisma stoltei TaxID=1481888 RepID=A0AAU9IRG9_9CILI|nr:unnamed protein product [Blepharisma stoltei]
MTEKAHFGIKGISHRKLKKAWPTPSIFASPNFDSNELQNITQDASIQTPDNPASFEVNEESILEKPKEEWKWSPEDNSDLLQEEFKSPDKKISWSPDKRLEEIYKECSKNLVEDEKSSLFRVSVFPKIKLTKELVEFKQLVSAYQNLGEAPRKKNMQLRSSRSVSPTKRKRSNSDRSILGYQYKDFITKLSIEKRMAKCKNCNSVYCVCPDKISDDFLKEFLKEHEKKTSRCEEIKQEIGNIQSEVERHLYRYRLRSKPESISTKNFFVGEVNDYESPPKWIFHPKQRLSTPAERAVKTPIPAGRRSETPGVKVSAFSHNAFSNGYDPIFKVVQAGFSQRKSSRKENSSPR